ncbi:MAG: cation diffusion facilitator family transporter [Oscillospiraceae bacterium]|jgi:cation diffusion facilitator family transporter|nr:cation diffusion facilitator family transporter [Oscillospiraceae bacterium]
MTELFFKTFVKGYKRGDDNDNDVRYRCGFAVSVFGIVLNVLLFVVKMFAGIITMSVAITADAVNNLFDSLSSGVTLAGFRMSQRPADKEHPFGHGRAEYVAGLAVAMLIIFTGAEFAKETIGRIIGGEEAEISLGAVSLVILAVSVLVKVFMVVFYRSAGKSLDSTALKVAAADSLSDVCGTVAVLLGNVLYLAAGINIDVFLGMFVALLIVYNGLMAAKDVTNLLLGAPPDKELLTAIEDVVTSYDGIMGVHDLVVHNYGIGRYIISLHAEVPDNMDFIAAHELIDEIETKLSVKFRSPTTIHLDPVAYGDKVIDGLRSAIREFVKTIDTRLTVHDFRKTNGANRENLIFDIAAPFDCAATDAELRAKTAAFCKEIDTKYETIIKIDRM